MRHFSSSRCAVALVAALAMACFGNAALGQLSVTDYSFTVAPTSNYANQNTTVLINGTALVNVWPNSADQAQLVGWFETNPGIQFNFTGGQSVSEVTIWAANSKGSAGVWLPSSFTVTSGGYSKTLTVSPPSGSGTTVPLTITGLSAAADSFTITAVRDITSGSPSGWTMFSEVQFAGTGAKAANTNALNLASSWTGGRAPVSTDVPLFNSTFTSTTPLDTGAAVNWAGMKVTGGSGTLTIDPTTSASRLGIGTSGIDLSASTRNVRLTDLRLTGSTAQTWSIASGRSLTVGADSLAQDAGANPTLSGAGTLVKEGSSTSLRLGSLTSFTGTLDVQAGSVTTSAANQLTGNYAVSLAAAATLQLAGNDTLPTSMNSGTGTIEILQSNALTITNSAARTVDRAFSGTGSLTKTGAGTLTLSGNNTFSGGLTFGTGTVKAGSNTALGSGTITVNGTGDSTGGTLDLDGATLANAIVITNGNSGMGSFGALQNTKSSTAAVLNGTVQIGGQNYVGGDGDITLNGVVSGGSSTSYSLFKRGAGVWTFANEANTFDGFYYQIGGVTEVTKLANAGEASSLGQVTSGQNLFVFGFNGADGGTLRYIGNSASTSDRVFSLRGSTGAADNTIEAAGTSADATLTLTGGLSAGRAGNYTARLAGDNAGENVYAGVIANGSGTVALEKTGATTWVLTGANTYSGGTTVGAGTLQVGAGGAAGSLGSGAVSVATGATLAFDRSNGLTVASVISGSGVVTQTGSGTTSLTADNTYTGATEVTAGTLSLGNGGTSGAINASSAVSIATGATLAVDRSNTLTLLNTISGSGAVAKRGSGTLTLSGGNSHAGGTRLEGGTLVVGSDTALGSGAVVFANNGVTLETTRNITNAIAMNANGTLAAGSGSMELSGDFTGSGTLTKTGTGTLTLAGTASTFTGNLVIGGGSGLNSIVKAGSANAFGSGTVTILGGGGNTGSTFDLNGFSLDNGLVIGAGNSGVGDTGALQNNGASRATLNGTVSSGGEIYVGGAGDITFNGVVSGGVNPSNPYSFYKDGTGTWTFANTANTFDGFYYLFNGATEVASLANVNESSALGRPTDATRNRVVFGLNGNGGGTLRYIGDAASTSDRAFVLSGLTGAERNTIEAAGTSADATLTLTGGLSAGRAGNYTARLAGDNAGENVYAGVIANGSGTVALEKTGGTTWVLTGANGYTGATTISDGTLQVGGGGTIGTLGGTGAIANDGTLAFNRSDAVALDRAVTGAGSLAQRGAGTLTLSGNNTYSGGTTVAAGRLVGNTASLQGAIANNAFVEFSQSTNGTYAGAMSGNGALIKSSAGTLTLAGTNTYSGGTTVTAGRLVGNATSLQGAIANSGVVEFNQSGDGAYAGAISGSGSLTKSGAGKLVMSGTNTYNGATTVSAGELNVNGSIANSAVSVASGASLSGSGTVGVISGAGSVGPGNSPGILTAPSVDPSGGLSFNFEFTSLNPTYSNASASVNDVLRMTDTSPFVAALTSANVVNIFFNVATFAEEQVYTGGFFTDTRADFLNEIVGATINYYVKDGDGVVSYGGQNYTALDEGLSITLSTVSARGDFAGGTAVDGQVMQLEVVPEPSTYALLALAAAGLGVRWWRNRFWVR